MYSEHAAKQLAIPPLSALTNGILDYISLIADNDLKRLASLHYSFRADKLLFFCEHWAHPSITLGMIQNEMFMAEDTILACVEMQGGLDAQHHILIDCNLENIIMILESRERAYEA